MAKISILIVGGICVALALTSFGITQEGLLVSGFGGILILVGLFAGGKSAPMIEQMPQQGMAPGMMAPVQGNQPMGEPPQQQYTVGADIDSSKVADTPITVGDY